MDFIVGGLAASSSTIFTNPFDVLKTRMQLQGELKSKGRHAVYYRNVFHAAYMVGKYEGLSGLQKGLFIAIPLHGLRNFVRLGIYQWFQRNGFLTDHYGKTIFYKSALISALAGAAGAFIGSPLFLVKTQLQSQAAEKIAVGHQHGHSGIIQAFWKIYTKHGITGLWRGASATMVRALAGSSAQLSTFAITKDRLRESEFFKRSPTLTSLVSSIIGGFFQTVFMQPFDLISTRLYNQGTDVHGRGLLYTGILDASMKIIKKEGVTGFYKGITANYMRLAPHGALTLVFWDILKDLQSKYFT